MATVEKTREQWLAERQQGLGASDSPAAIGISPYKSRFALWAEKTGLAEPEDLSGNEAVEFGIRLERPIAEAFADRTGRHVEMWPQFETVRDADRNWLSCTPDAIQEHECRCGLVQVKTAGQFKAAEWADGPPLPYLVQLNHELHVTGYDWGTLVVLIGGQRLRYFDCERNDKFLEALIPRLAEFWALVESRTPPEVDDSFATARVLQKLHPDDNGEVLALPPEAERWAEQLVVAKAGKKEAEQQEQEAKNHLQALLGDATFGVTPGGQIFSWRTQERKGYEVAPSVARVFRSIKKLPATTGVRS